MHAFAKIRSLGTLKPRNSPVWGDQAPERRSWPNVAIMAHLPSGKLVPNLIAVAHTEAIHFHTAEHFELLSPTSGGSWNWDYSYSGQASAKNELDMVHASRHNTRLTTPDRQDRLAFGQKYFKFSMYSAGQKFSISFVF